MCINPKETEFRANLRKRAIEEHRTFNYSSIANADMTSLMYLSAAKRARPQFLRDLDTDALIHLGRTMGAYYESSELDGFPSDQRATTHTCARCGSDEATVDLRHRNFCANPERQLISALTEALAKILDANF